MWVIDEDKMRPSETQLVTLDPHHPPLKQVPDEHWPRLVYKHPNEPFIEIEHRNARREVVQTEMVPAEHIYKSVSNPKELAAALKEGWVEKPFVPPAPPDPKAHLYSKPE